MDDRTERTPVVIDRDVLVAVHDDVELRADLYRPDGPGPFPAVLLIHGGGWRGASKVHQWEGWGRLLASHGYVALAVPYRLSDEGASRFMESVWDVQAGVRYLRGRADLAVDPARVGAMGVSAGGHLAAMLALTSRLDEFASPYDDPYASEPADVDVVVGVYGVYDMIAQWEHDQLTRPHESITAIYLGGSPADVRERFYAASPLYHASRQNASGTNWLLVWGEEDRIVDPQQSRTMANHLTRAGATVRIHPVPGAPHYWFLGEPVDAEPAASHAAAAAPRVLTFLDGTTGAP